MNYYKVLRNDLKSPVMKKQYEIGKTYKEPDFDTSDAHCSKGLYYLELHQINSWLQNKGKDLFEVKPAGRIKKFHNKSRCSKMTILRKSNHILFTRKCLIDIDEIFRENDFSSNREIFENLLLTIRLIYKKYDKDYKHKRLFIQFFITKFYHRFYWYNNFTDEDYIDMSYGFLKTLYEWNKE